jgi:hypothetical protein
VHAQPLAFSSEAVPVDFIHRPARQFVSRW